MDEVGSYSSSLYSLWDSLYPHCISNEEFLKKIQEQEQEEQERRDNQSDFAEGYPSPICVFIYLLQKRIDKCKQYHNSSEVQSSYYQLLSSIIDLCEEEQYFLRDLRLSQYQLILQEFSSTSHKVQLLILWVISKFLLENNKQGQEIWNQFKVYLSKKSI